MRTAGVKSGSVARSINTLHHQVDFGPRRKMLTQCYAKGIRMLLVICMATLLVLQTTASSNAQEIWHTWRGIGEWVSEKLTPNFDADIVIPHPSVAVKGDTQKLYVAYFGMRGCAGCKTMSPRMDQLREKGWKVYKFDAQVHKLAVRLLLKSGDKSLPKMVIMNKGQPVEIVSGTPSVSDLMRKLERIRDGEPEEQAPGTSTKTDYNLFG